MQLRCRRAGTIIAAAAFAIAAAAGPDQAWPVSSKITAWSDFAVT